jgi:hypothetical protein
MVINLPPVLLSAQAIQMAECCRVPHYTVMKLVVDFRMS